VGINKVNNREQFEDAVNEAFLYDNKIIIEEYIEGREIECSILGNDDPIASLPGEILPQDEFYSYDAKYINEDGALLEVPAKLPENIVKEVQECAIQSFKVLCCEGMARVDLFLKKSGEIVMNEINTIPGFTKISMYPKLWEASGIPYSELIHRLIQLGIERFKREEKLETSVHI
jgi:D-alanine-D-alanine ligase